MSLALKRNYPFTLSIYPFNATSMDPDPYKQNYRDRDPYAEWSPTSTTTIPEEPYPTSSQRSPSPPKRPRNAKNLSLTVPAPSKVSSTSAPVSPFRSPRLPSRRPSGLTLNIHSLHRHPSTPELHSTTVGSPIVQSPGPLTSRQFPSLKIDSNRTSPPIERLKTRHTDPSITETTYEESVDREKAYPDGPRLIVEPNIWLYAEPDLELAKTYDVVVNVAKEVVNPFILSHTPEDTPSPRSDSTHSPFSPTSSISNPSPSLPSSVSSGTSPSQVPFKTEARLPISYKYDDVEYIHIPWDHNSSLSQDLPGIVDHILERAEQGKKILVHCQCGVSRSATLVIALVMKKMRMGTHEAYAYVKDRSPWIGPNMSLIYQLTDYGRLCGYERKSSINPNNRSSGQFSAPSTAPLENAESRRYKESEPLNLKLKSVQEQSVRPTMGRTQSQDRHEFLDVEVDQVADTLSSPRFVVSEEGPQKE